MAMNDRFAQMKLEQQIKQEEEEWRRRKEDFEKYQRDNEKRNYTDQLFMKSITPSQSNFWCNDGHINKYIYCSKLV